VRDPTNLYLIKYGAASRLPLNPQSMVDHYAILYTQNPGSVGSSLPKDWNKERNKEVARKKKKGTGEVREKWSPEDHGLVAFFDANPSLKKKLRIVDEKKPHVIDLAEKLTDSWPVLAD
jgi:hypothetical protein